MPCRWMHDPKIGRWWYPECMGGIYGREGCTCPRTARAKQHKIDELERRIDQLETKLRQYQQLEK